MKCINGARTFLFYNIHQQQHHQHYHHHLLNSKTRSCPQHQRYFYANTQTTHAVLLSDLVVILSSAAAAAADINIIAQPKADIKVFLQTGGLMLSAYLLANFVVPNIVMKQLSDEAKEPESSVDVETSNEQQQTPTKTKNRVD